MQAFSASDMVFRLCVCYVLLCIIIILTLKFVVEAWEGRSSFVTDL